MGMEGWNYLKIGPLKRSLDYHCEVSGSKELGVHNKCENGISWCPMLAANL